MGEQVQVPEGAQDVEGVKLINRVVTFVTRNQSSIDSVKPTSKGLEIRFAGHPNDLFANEPMNVTLLFDGKPLGNTSMHLTRAFTRYRNDHNQIEIKTDAKGKAAVHWQGPGLYLLEAELMQSVNADAFKTLIHRLYLTLEFFPE